MGSVSGNDKEHDLDVIAKSNDMGWSLTGAQKRSAPPMCSTSEIVAEVTVSGSPEDQCRHDPRLPRSCPPD